MITQKPRADRMSKDRADYIEHSPSYETCATCSMYGLGNCSLVEGSINPHGWCRYWERIASKAR